MGSEVLRGDLEAVALGGAIGVEGRYTKAAALIGLGATGVVTLAGLCAVGAAAVDN